MTLALISRTDQPSRPGVDQPFPAYGGLFREEAIMLLRRFYVQENGKGTSVLVFRHLVC